jgi:hypothetical protein
MPSGLGETFYGVVLLLVLWVLVQFCTNFMDRLTGGKSKK